MLLCTGFFTCSGAWWVFHVSTYTRRAPTLSQGWWSPIHFHPSSMDLGFFFFQSFGTRNKAAIDSLGQHFLIQGQVHLKGTSSEVQ